MYSIFKSELTAKSEYDGLFKDQYSRYINIVALARQAQLEEFYKVPIDKLEEEGYTLSIATAHINFIRKIKTDEALIVQTQLDNFSGGACNINFWIYKKDNQKLAADGYFVYVLTSLKSNMTVQFPKELKEKLSI